MDWSNKKVLIAEDEEANYLLLVEYLESTGIQIFRATDGYEVLNIVANEKPDLILMDMKMPRMTGYEAVKIIRETDSKIPIIAQTAYAMVGDDEKILEVGCNEYLPKPIDEESLVKTVTKYLSS